MDREFGQKSSREIDVRSGRKVGHDDHVVVWKEPKYVAARYESRQEWESLPEESPSVRFV